MPASLPLRAVLVLAACSVGIGSSACASASAASGPVAFPRAHSVGTSEDAATGAAGIGTAVVETALAFVGIPYRLGGDTPAAGFDCSGLVWYALAQHQIDVPRTVTEQYAAGHPVGRGDLQPGDLVFFSTVGPGATHVGILLDPDTDRFVHAPSEGGSVRVEQLDTSYWRSRYVGARRVF